MTKITITIDGAHREETRIAVLGSDGKLLDFDRSALAIKQIKGNIYLAKVTRVEPSLQACFVDYGSDRHGFLPFADIHPELFIKKKSSGHFNRLPKLTLTPLIIIDVRFGSDLLKPFDWVVLKILAVK